MSIFKFFTLVFLVAIAAAKGKNDGSDRDNAVSTVLIETNKVSLTLHSYNLENQGT